MIYNNNVRCLLMVVVPVVSVHRGVPPSYQNTQRPLFQFSLEYSLTIVVLLKSKFDTLQGVIYSLPSNKVVG